MRIQDLRLARQRHYHYELRFSELTLRESVSDMATKVPE
jgi:hypothetical protein